MDSVQNDLGSWIREVLVSRFDVPGASVLPDARLREDLGLDSLDHVDLVLEMELCLGRRIENTDFSGVRTVRDVLELLERLGASPVR